MPDELSALYYRLTELESRVTLAERALTVEMLALIRELPAKELEEE